MKKFTLVVVTLLVCSLTTLAQVRFGVVGATQLASQSFSFGTEALKDKSRLGYQVGVMADIMLADNLSFRPNLLYSVKGTKLPDLGLGDLFGGLLGDPDGSGNPGGSVDLDDLGLSVRTSFSYIELPLQVVYCVDAGPGWINLGAGPYVSYALSGKTTVSFLGQSESEPISFGSGEEGAKRLDYGLRLSVGYEMPSGLMLTGYYSPGLANITRDPEQKIRNTTFGLSLGFLFGGE